MNGADPIGRTQVFALITGDCDQGQFAEDVIERHGMREVETTVESRDGASNKVPDQRAVQKIDVKMQNVKPSVRYLLARTSLVCMWVH